MNAVVCQGHANESEPEVLSRIGNEGFSEQDWQGWSQRLSREGRDTE